MTNRFSALTVVLIALVLLGCKPVEKSPDLEARIAFAEEMDKNWDSPGDGYMLSVHATGPERKTLDVSMPVSRKDCTEVPVSEIRSGFDLEKRAKERGFEKIEIAHCEWVKDTVVSLK